MREVHDEDLMRRFLLGEVDSEERQHIEDRFMADPEYFEALCALEDELLVSHVRGDLALQWRSAFDAHVLGSPARRRRVEDTQRLVNALRASQASARPLTGRPKLVRSTTRFSMVLAAAAAVVAAILTGWVVFRPADSRRQASATNEARRIDTGAIATFVLTPGLTRSELGPSNVFRLPPEARQIRLELSELSTNSGSLHTELRVVGGGPVSVPTEPEIRRNGDRVEISWLVPASLLSRGDYLLALRGETATHEPETLASRFFSIVE